MTDIELIKDRLDIVDLISGYVELKRAGANYRGLCPFHLEKSPSFMVNTNLQIFKCFGCGKGGDAITFIQEIERLDFPEALKIAAEKAGVELSNKGFKKDKAKEEEKKKILEANQLAANFYNYILNTHKLGKPGRDYAQKRQLGSHEIKTFLIGYAPSGRENLKNLLIKRGFKEEDLVKWGLLIDREGQIMDKFRNRFMQPVRNAKGEVIGFSGRYIGESKDVPKYLNSPETPVFKKNELLYGIFEGGDSIRKQKFVIIVEGNIDVISSHRAEVPNILAPLGTAFTPNQAKLLKRYAEEVYFAFDNDEAGKNALIRSLKIVEDAGLNHKTIDLGEFKDADEIICNDVEEWKKKVAEPINTVEYLLRKLETGLDLGSPDGRSKFRDLVLPILKSLKDEVQKSYFKQYVAGILGLSHDVMDEELENIKMPRYTHHQEANESIVQRSSSNVSQDSFVQERNLLSIILNYPDELKHEFKTEHLRHKTFQELFEILIETRGPIPKEILETLDEEIVREYSEVSLRDVSSIKDFNQAIKDIYKYLHHEHLKQMKEEADRKYINDQENEEYLNVLAEIAREKKRMSQI